MSRFDEFDGAEDDFDAGPEMSGALTVGENDIDAGLRPKSLREFIGQPRVNVLLTNRALDAELGGPAG